VLELIGLPAAVLGRQGQAFAMNQGCQSMLRTTTRGGPRLGFVKATADRRLNRRFNPLGPTRRWRITSRGLLEAEAATAIMCQCRFCREVADANPARALSFCSKRWIRVRSEPIRVSFGW
jgi:hypothetical protein